MSLVLTGKFFTIEPLGKPSESVFSSFLLFAIFIFFFFLSFAVVLLGASQVALVVKNPPANAGDIRDRDVGSIPGVGRSPGEGHGNPLQYSCLKNPMDNGAWQAIVHRVAKSWT